MQLAALALGEATHPVDLARQRQATASSTPAIHAPRFPDNAGGTLSVFGANLYYLGDRRHPLIDEVPGAVYVGLPHHQRLHGDPDNIWVQLDPFDGDKREASPFVLAWAIFKSYIAARPPSRAPASFEDDTRACPSHTPSNPDVYPANACEELIGRAARAAVCHPCATSLASTSATSLARTSSVSRCPRGYLPASASPFAYMPCPSTGGYRTPACSPKCSNSIERDTARPLPSHMDVLVKQQHPSFLHPTRDLAVDILTVFDEFIALLSADIHSSTSATSLALPGTAEEIRARSSPSFTLAAHSCTYPALDPLPAHKVAVANDVDNSTESARPLPFGMDVLNERHPSFLHLTGDLDVGILNVFDELIALLNADIPHGSAHATSLGLPVVLRSRCVSRHPPFMPTGIPQLLWIPCSPREHVRCRRFRCLASLTAAEERARARPALRYASRRRPMSIFPGALAGVLRIPAVLPARLSAESGHGYGNAERRCTRTACWPVGPIRANTSPTYARHPSARQPASHVHVCFPASSIHLSRGAAEIHTRSSPAFEDLGPSLDIRIDLVTHLFDVPSADDALVHDPRPLILGENVPSFEMHAAAMVDVLLPPILHLPYIYDLTIVLHCGTAGDARAPLASHRLLHNPHSARYLDVRACAHCAVSTLNQPPLPFLHLMSRSRIAESCD
ncbi:hypothetical protein B0H13DRAFT_2358222 [Mycena leptocephala]|nr:hypothetical protein B0H13DRAFT_2358222 [Mycena leptocephala]